MANSKKQGQRLIPEYLLKYATELEERHPDPSASWGGGGGGGEYTAGDGIDISEENVISVDNTVALKSEIPDVSGFVTETDMNTALADYELKSEAFSGSYNDLTDKPDLSIYAESEDLATVATTGDYDDLLNKPTIPTKTSDLTNDSGFITGVSWNDVTGKPTFATVATSGDYDDLLNKPTIPTVDYPVTDVQVDGVSVVSNKVASITMPTVPTKTSDLQNDSGFITGVSWNDVTNKPTFATVATSGSYNDLTDKPTIPAGESEPFLRVTDANNVVFFSLTGASNTFYKWLDVSNEGPININLHALNPVFGSGLTATYNTGTSQLDVSIDTTTVALKTDIPTVPTTVSSFTNDAGYITSSALSGYATETWVGQQGFLTSVSWNDVSSKPTFATVATSGSYTDLTDKPTIPTVPVTDVQVNGTSVLSGTVANITGVQETLVSGTNIKTINNQSILGSGNITISGSAAPYEITAMTVDSTNNTITLTITANE